VGSVLSSIVKAQGLAASQLVEMIDKVGFEPAVAGEPRRTRTFAFEFFRTEVDETTNELVRQKVTAHVPLLTLINLPSIAIHEAKVQMDLRLVAHQESGADADPDEAQPPVTPLRLYAVPARKQLVRTAQEAFAIDSAGTIKIEMTMRQEPAVGLDKIQSMLESGAEERIALAAPDGTEAGDEPESPDDAPTPPPAGDNPEPGPSRSRLAKKKTSSAASAPESRPARRKKPRP